jgi:UDP-glucose 4-epimerase
MLTHLIEPPRAPARVVILGATGFVPRALHQRLSRDSISVSAFGRSDLDLTEPASAAKLAAALRPDDVLVMTAALTPEKGRDVAKLIKNLRMAEHVITAVTTRPCAHVIYFSSDAVYDPRLEEVSETSAAAPADLYGAMHLARELAFRQAMNAAKIPFCVLRLCAIYGPGDTHNSYGPNRFVRSALADGKIKLFGAGEEIRDHLFIDDVTELATQIILRRSTGTLNLVTGQPVSFAELAAEIARLVETPVAIETQPRTSAVAHRRFATAEIQRAFPKHRPTPLRAGLHAMIGSLRTPAGANPG